MKKYVAYYRVSTAQQRDSGLGLDAQRDIVSGYLNAKPSDLIAEYTEVESGTKNDRPKLLEAINLCKRRGATLVIAKLDRLSRNHYFITTLMESKVQFVACDLPEANPFTIHIFSALAQQERELISTRTKQALKALKDKGISLGKPENLSRASMAKGRLMGNKVKSSKADEFARLMFPVIEEYQQEGLSLRAIATKLNEAGELTASGKVGAWTPTAVKNVISRIQS